MSRRKGPAPTSRAFRRASKTVVEPKAVEFDAEGKPTRHTKRHRLAEPLKPRARRLAAHGDELAVRWCRNKGIGP